MGLFTSSKEKDTYKVSPIPERLQKKERVLIITADNTEDMEFFYPYYRLTEAGYTVDVVTPEGGKFAAKHGLGLQETQSINDVNPADYRLIYIPGGKAPESLRTDERILAFVKTFAESGKPIAAICHGPQVLISAGLLRGKQIAAWPDIADEVRDAEAIFVDEALVIDGQFITARMPGDLPRHLAGVMDVLEGKIANTNRSERKSSAA